MNIENILIIGAQGQMGRLFARRSQDAGLTVRGLDRPLTAEAVAQGARGAQMVLLAVPAAAMADVSGMCAEAMGPQQILVDLCSVKTAPLDDMLAAHPGPVVGTHPLFGPNPDPGDVRVAMVPGRDDAAFEAVCAYMRRLGFAPFTTNVDEHDLAMASIQGLNFVTTVSYLATLANRPEFERFITPSFNRRLEAARKMLTEDSELFASLVEINPYTQEAVRNFRSLLNIAAGGDIELLSARANWWWRNGQSGGGV
ncbi:MAG: prephenate dehydrogenase/arogenate dehydrogenase family protein [Proteobacteria bacterium]|nr:prephenate dehydrogenase/arogenate dehydrogenase family protein [Pseudomonadota bacterium]